MRQLKVGSFLSYLWLAAYEMEVSEAPTVLKR